jgi:hypothetical protein
MKGKVNKMNRKAISDLVTVAGSSLGAATVQVLPKAV